MRDTGDKGVFAEDNSEIMEINPAGVVLSYYRNKYGLKAQALMHRYGPAALKEDDQGVFGGHDVRWKIQQECLMAYSICEVFGDMQQMEAIRRFCEEELRWQITGLEIGVL